MDKSRRRALTVLALSSAGAVFVWLLKRKPSEPEVVAHPRAAAPTPSGQPALPARTPYGAAPGPMRTEDQPEPSAASEVATSAGLEPADEQYESPYAEHGPREEARLLKLAVEHQEAMLRYAEQRLDTFEEDGEEADLEFEQQLRAVEEGRAQTEAFKRRIRQLDEGLR